jgi:kinesin family protein 5
MEGDICNDLTKGIIPRAITALFDGIATLQDQTHAFMIKVSFVEIYMEKIRDLLDRNNRAANLPIRENRIRGIYIDGATEEVVHSVEELLHIMRLGKVFFTFSVLCFKSLRMFRSQESSHGSN